MCVCVCATIIIILASGAVEVHVFLCMNQYGLHTCTIVGIRVSQWHVHGMHVTCIMSIHYWYQLIIGLYAITIFHLLTFSVVLELK